MSDNVSYINDEIENAVRRSGNDGGSGMEARIAKIEARVDNIDNNISDIKADIRDSRGALWAVLGILTALIIGSFAITMTYLLHIAAALPK